MELKLDDMQLDDSALHEFGELRCDDDVELHDELVDMLLR